MKKSLLSLTLMALVSTASAGALDTYFEYDAQGNLTKRTDGLGQSERYVYDSLDQLTEHIDPNQDSIHYTRDGQGNVIEVQAPNWATTSYGIDGLGQTWIEDSPDRGEIANAFNDAGLLLERVNALGATRETDYDVLGRITQRRFLLSGAQQPEYTHVYTWDTAANGIGHLASLDTGENQLSYGYDIEGRLTERTLTRQGVSLATYWAYDGPTGRLASMTYPSGAVLSYSYDAAGRVRTVSWGGQTVAGLIEYDPFGPINAYALANGTDHLRQYDSAGRLVSYTLGGHAVQLSYDAAGRITAIDAPTDPSRDLQQFGYDPASRLVSYTDATRQLDYGYDGNGNRSFQTFNGSTLDYTYAAFSNQQTKIGTTDQQRNAAGDLENDGTRVFEYDSTGRIKRLTALGVTTTYEYNGLGERTVKTVGAAAPIHYVYDPAGHLIGEYDELGEPLKEYAWLGDVPVALKRYSYAGGQQSSELFAIEVDHLGTPRLVTDSLLRERWRWDSTPFGDVVPDSDPAGVGQLTLNLRFPGQYYDAESGLHYNYFRTYIPATGRYVESDPIGLAGGINTYGYVGGNPLSAVDPDGLNPLLVNAFWRTMLARLGVPLTGPRPDWNNFRRTEGSVLENPNVLPGASIPSPAENASGDDSSSEGCPPSSQQCPPCETVSGKIVPLGKISYRPLDTPDKPEHGIDGPHYNIYKANQNPKNCRCFWQSIGAVAPSDLPADAMPIEPFKI